MKFILVLGFAISSFILSSIAHAVTATDIPVIGAIDGIVLEGDQYYIDGWACQKTATTPLRLHIYAGASAYDSPQGVNVASGSVQYAAEQSIKDQCASQVLARFHVAISDAVLAANAGKKVYVHGLRVIGDVENSALTNSGSLSFPAPIAQNPRGCMPSIRTELTDRNTYPSADAQGQGQDWVYKAWVWRDSTDVSTNHSVSVARSKDLKNWYNTCGEKLTLPINSRARATIDPIQMNQGLLNNVKVGFDNLGNPIVTYQKYKTVYSTTAAPYVTTQVYNARLENGVWNIHQVTNWTTKNYLYGGGAIPSDPTTIGFSAVQPDPAGNNIQTLNRASSDLTGTPTSGAWILDNQLNVTGNKAPINLDPFHPTISPAAMPAPEPRVDGWVTPFKYRRYWARTQRDAVVLRGNWDGDGSRGGIFMQKTRTFYLFRQDGTRSAIPFGPGSIPLLPLVGDWNNDGLSTIGVLDSITNKYYLKNTLAGGGADLSGIGSVASLADTDGPMHWSSVDPSHTYYLSHEYIPTNRDSSYSCKGEPQATFQNTTDICPQNFLTNLNLYEYDLTLKQWIITPIDKAWGGPASFDLMVFKGYQIAAYYDQNRNVKIAIRKGRGAWSYQILDDVYLGWDAHNSLTLEVDENHDIHLSGDQHANPLNYWRSSGLTTNFKRMPMVAPSEEQQSTYPRFYRSPQGELLFTYRNGYSGNGSWIINKYDVLNRKWIRFLSTPLFGNQ